MAFWGAPFEEPGHAARACNTALKMMERVREMQKQWEAEGKPHLDIGTGLSTNEESRRQAATRTWNPPESGRVQRRQHGLGAPLRLHRVWRAGIPRVAMGGTQVV